MPYTDTPDAVIVLNNPNCLNDFTIHVKTEKFVIGSGPNCDFRISGGDVPEKQIIFEFQNGKWNHMLIQSPLSVADYAYMSPGLYQIRVKASDNHHYYFSFYEHFQLYQNAFNITKHLSIQAFQRENKLKSEFQELLEAYNDLKESYEELESQFIEYSEGSDTSEFEE